MREMREDTQDTPWWMELEDIVGYEDDGEDEESDDEEDESDDSDDDSEENSDEENDEGDEDEDEGDKPNIDGLKSALRKERMSRKRAERELKQLRTKKPPKKKPAPEVEEGEDESASVVAAQEQSKKLAAGFRTAKVDALIERHAIKLGFQDTEDAMRLVDRTEIEVDQDDDDPSVIEVDEESIVDALKALKKRKPHLIARDKTRPSSGSKFGGGKSSSKTPSEDALRTKYPALRR